MFVTIDAFPIGWLGAVPMALCLLLWIMRTVFVVNLTSVEPFWQRKNGLPNTYPPIDQDQNLDILVVGAGVTGAMIAHLSELVGRLKIQCDVERKTSLYLATDRKAAKLLADEARARQAIKLEVKYHPQSEVSDRFHVSGVAALSSKQAASCDHYLLTHDRMEH